jgi:hypothetical protein
MFHFDGEKPEVLAVVELDAARIAEEIADIDQKISVIGFHKLVSVRPVPRCC